MNAPVSWREAAFPALVAFVLTLVWYLAFGNVHLNVIDEGYLWYGVQRTVAGEVPVRDFQAYDPGRYWWSAAWAPLLGTGILGVRKAAALFQAVGLCFGLLAARRAVKRELWLIPIGILLIAWMFPRHKVYESALAMAAVWFGLRLLENPSARQHFATGAFVGLAGILGKNHAAYACVGTFLLMLFVAFRIRPEGTSFVRSFAAWTAGGFAGFAPILIMFAVVPGFAASYVDWTLAYVKLGGNIPYPWPWPWRVGYAGSRWFELLAQLGRVLSFFLPVIVIPAGLVAAWRADRESLPRRALLIASTVLGVFYLHHAAVRSDTPHYAQCVQPILLGLLALPVAFGWEARRVALGVAWGGFGFLSFFFLLEDNHLLQPYRLGQEVRLVEHAVQGETLRTFPGRAAYFERLERTVEEHVGEGALFIAPSRPGLYPLLGKAAPTWWIYFFIPDAEEELQRGLIEDLEGVDWLLFVDVAIAKQERFRFRNSHPLVWEHVQREYRRVPTPDLPADHLLLRRRSGP